MAEMDNYTGSVPRKIIPLRLEAASNQESATEPTGVAQTGSGSLDIASLLKQDGPGGLLEQFLSDKSVDRTDSGTGSSIGQYASGVVEKCVQLGVDQKEYGRTSPVEDVPKVTESVEGIAVSEPQTSGETKFSSFHRLPPKMPIYKTLF